MSGGNNGAGTEALTLNKVLGPIHIWGLGVGIVLVGEFMGGTSPWRRAASTVR